MPGANFALSGMFIGFAAVAGLWAGANVPGRSATLVVEQSSQSRGVSVPHGIPVPHNSPLPKAVLNTSSVVGSYLARITSAHDGDSLRAQVAVWPSQLMDATIRLRGVDTPELNSKCKAERQLARQARDYVRARTVGQAVTLTDISRGKYYGRVVASVTLDDGQSLGDLLLQEGLGIAYGGGQRANWCEMMSTL